MKSIIKNYSKFIDNKFTKSRAKSANHQKIDNNISL